MSALLALVALGLVLAVAGRDAALDRAHPALAGVQFLGPRSRFRRLVATGRRARGPVQVLPCGAFAIMALLRLEQCAGVRQRLAGADPARLPGALSGGAGSGRLTGRSGLLRGALACPCAGRLRRRLSRCALPGGRLLRGRLLRDRLLRVDFFAVDFFAVDFFAVDFFAVDFFAVDFFVVVFFTADFLAVLFFSAVFCAGDLRVPAPARSCFLAALAWASNRLRMSASRPALSWLRRLASPLVPRLLPVRLREASFWRCSWSRALSRSLRVRSTRLASALPSNLRTALARLSSNSFISAFVSRALAWVRVYGMGVLGCWERGSWNRSLEQARPNGYHAPDSRRVSIRLRSAHPNEGDISFSTKPAATPGSMIRVNSTP
jgi:hypothetical protein